MELIKKEPTYPNKNKWTFLKSKRAHVSFLKCFFFQNVGFGDFYRLINVNIAQYRGHRSSRESLWLPEACDCGRVPLAQKTDSVFLIRAEWWVRGDGLSTRWLCSWHKEDTQSRGPLSTSPSQPWATTAHVTSENRPLSWKERTSNSASFWATKETVVTSQWSP